MDPVSESWFPGITILTGLVPTPHETNLILTVLDGAGNS